MKEVQKKLPSKKRAIVITIIFLITQFFYLATNFGNMPILRDTFNISAFPGFVLFFNKYYFNFDVIMTAIQSVIFAYLLRAFTTNGYPSLITLITNFWNLMICAGSAVGLFIMNARNIPLSVQIMFVFPILSIFVSSVALIDDCGDVYRGSFQLYVSRTTQKAQKKFQKSMELVQEHNPLAGNEEHSEMEILSIEETLQLHQQKIADAAERAYPKFNDH